MDDKKGKDEEILYNKIMEQLQPSVMHLLKHIWNVTKLVGSCVWMIKKGKDEEILY